MKDNHLPLVLLLRMHQGARPDGGRAALCLVVTRHPRVGLERAEADAQHCDRERRARFVD